MTVEEVYKHITKHITAEKALMKLLEGHVITYEKLKFEEGKELHPIILISMATLEMGWDFAVPEGCDDEDIHGMVVGTEEYINSVLGIDNCTCGSDCDCKKD